MGVIWIDSSQSGQISRRLFTLKIDEQARCRAWLYGGNDMFAPLWQQLM